MSTAAPYDSKSLKALNIWWLGLLILLDILILLIFVFPEVLATASFSQVTAGRSALMTMLPIIVLLLSSVISQKHKAVLVYWKTENPLPGSEAFTKYGPADPRVDMDKLKKHVGQWPTDAQGQNTFWYGLYKLVDSAPAVVEAHKQSLRFRDMAAMSIILSVVVPICFAFMLLEAWQFIGGLALFAVQYLICSHTGRHFGIQFVSTVLAEHSFRKVAVPAAAPRTARKTAAKKPKAGAA